MKKTLEYYDYEEVNQFLLNNNFSVDFWNILTDLYDDRIKNGGYVTVWCSNHINNRFNEEIQNVFKFLQQHLGNRIAINTIW